MNSLVSEILKDALKRHEQRREEKDAHLRERERRIAVVPQLEWRVKKLEEKQKVQVAQLKQRVKEVEEERLALLRGLIKEMHNEQVARLQLRIDELEGELRRRPPFHI